MTFTSQKARLEKLQFSTHCHLVFREGERDDGRRMANATATGFFPERTEGRTKAAPPQMHPAQPSEHRAGRGEPRAHTSQAREKGTPKMALQTRALSECSKATGSLHQEGTGRGAVSSVGTPRGGAHAADSRHHGSRLQAGSPAPRDADAGQRRTAPPPPHPAARRRKRTES